MVVRDNHRFLLDALWISAVHILFALVLLLSPSSGHVCELQHLWGTFLTIKVKSEHKFLQDKNTGSLDSPPDSCTVMHIKHDCVIVYSARAFWNKPRQYCSTWQCSTYRLSKDCLFIFILPAFPSSPICLSFRHICTPWTLFTGTWTLTTV